LREEIIKSEEKVPEKLRKLKIRLLSIEAVGFSECLVIREEVEVRVWNFFLWVERVFSLMNLLLQKGQGTRSDIEEKNKRKKKYEGN